MCSQLVLNWLSNSYWSYNNHNRYSYKMILIICQNRITWNFAQATGLNTGEMSIIDFPDSHENQRHLLEMSIQMVI